MLLQAGNPPQTNPDWSWRYRSSPGGGGVGLGRLLTLLKLNTFRMPFDVSRR